MTVLLTGGGSAGHVTPNLALMESLVADGHRCLYVGSRDGIERTLVSGIPYFAIASGKLRRYWSWQNLVDPFKVCFGFLQALFICLRERPDVVFSKGGFVTVPLVAAAWCCRIPVIIHESDVTPGLANRLCLPFARRVCITFAETADHLPTGKVRLTGTPVRAALMQGDAAHLDQALNPRGLPLLLVFGGSLGALRINAALRDGLEQLLPQFDIVHITGKGHVDEQLAQPGYNQFEFLGEQFGDLLAAAAVVVARAGANSLYELLILGKPHLLIPLPAAASRGDQLVNARTFAAKGLSRVLYEDEMTGMRLVQAIRALYADRDDLVAKLNDNVPQLDSIAEIRQVIQSEVEDKEIAT